MTENLIQCPCGKSDACFHMETEQIMNSMCYGCGFISNSLMKDGEAFFDEQIQLLPELHKDLIWKDNNEQKWMPCTVNIPDKGMVFMNGSSVENAIWSGVLAIPVTEEDKEKYPIPSKEGEFYKFRMDMTTLKNFDKYDFIEALSYIGVLPQ